eukprot:101365-Pyramimonas_sp.AAC.1
MIEVPMWCRVPMSRRQSERCRQLAAPDRRGTGSESMSYPDRWQPGRLTDCVGRRAAASEWKRRSGSHEVGGPPVEAACGQVGAAPHSVAQADADQCPEAAGGKCAVHAELRT